MPLHRFVSELLASQERNGNDAPGFPASKQDTGEPTTWKSPHNVTKYIP